LRQLLSSGGKSFGDDLTISVDIARRSEDYRHYGEALDGAGAQLLHSRSAVDGVLDRTCHQNFDLLRSKPYRLGLYADLGRRKFREDIQLGVA
jgi:hypothetical protein